MGLKGVAGKVAFVALSDGEVAEEKVPEAIYESYLGGYGLGAYYLYKRQPAGADPLGPDNMFGLLVGPLTGTDAITGNRFVVVGKSPKTGGWGDANCGGTLGPVFRAAGFDGLLFSGISPEPVYTLVEDGRATLHSAKHLWGLDSHETEDRLRDELGADIVIACVGPCGERKNLLACVMNDKGRAAGRSGLGAVMGSKRIKAIVARGKVNIEVADAERVKAARRRGMDAMQDSGFYQGLHQFGTCAITEGSAGNGDSPIKNWGGTPEDFPDAANLSGEKTIEYQLRRYGCWRCPIGCGGLYKVPSGPYACETHKPEYETESAFGSLCLNPNLESIAKLNDICNRAGMDTISTGGTLAFAIECFENGLYTKDDTGGLELTWGNHSAMVEVTEMIARSKGFGALLADGIKVAADKLGPRAQEFATHVRGEELAMHDPKLNPSLATSYQVEATPSRHTQLNAWASEAGFAMTGIEALFGEFDKYTYTGKGKANRVVSNFMHVVNAAGMCMFGACVIPYDLIPEFLSAVMGREFSVDDVLDIGDRIAALRTAFNVREGVSAAKAPVPGRMIGRPPFKAGPVADITVDVETQNREYFAEMGWDPESGIPKAETLKKLGLDFCIPDMGA